MSQLPAETPFVLKRIETLSRLFALAAGASVALLAVLICLDIGARSLLNVSLQGTDELGGYVLAFAGSCGLAYTLLHKGHPRIDIALSHLPRRGQNPAHVLAQGTLAAMAIFMTWHAAGELLQTIRFGAVTNTPLQTPLWVPQGLWALGCGVFALTTITTTLHAIWLMVQAPEKVSLFYGPMTVSEEVEEFMETPHGEARS
ncbi:TRAP transporter small permease [Sinirhodobacter huangdaonensis]|uniref:TRAP transporter small permease protein n=1 Tax=Paenirhodobacter huangdaonensis TaxID=2501515 RepID=A0A443LSP9_9RHOB|nr:TRAP transporter small permease [Sinirhodobacter huangdaonensis]